MRLLKKSENIQEIIEKIYLNLFAGFFDRDETTTVDDKCARIIIMSPTTCRDTYSYQLAQAWLDFEEPKCQ